MAPTRVTKSEALRLARVVLGRTDVDAEEVPVGYGNHNWRLRTSTGDFILKVGPVELAAKWAAGELGVAQALTSGLPVFPVKTRRIIGQHVVRVFDWIEGEPAHTLIDRPDAQARLGADLGAALAALHSKELDGFSSRLDATAPSFPTWPAYIAYRLDQIRARSESNSAPARRLRERASLLIGDLATEVSPHCRPVVCHRDLHADNLLVDERGALVAILDWDMPEIWDAAGEWFKLDFMLFAQLPDAAAPLQQTYDAHPAAGTAWDARKRLVQLIESLNIVANAPNQDPDFTSFAVDTLEELTAGGS